MLQLKVQDVRRATLPVRSGNEGWIGVSPRGDAYHVVVPVDVQIARGVMACNRPTDGTPFGGYSGWLYFRCPPYDDEAGDEGRIREEQTLITASGLIRFLKSYDIDAELVMEQPPHEGEGELRASRSAEGEVGLRTGRMLRAAVRGSRAICCTSCSTTWVNVAQFLRDPAVRLSRYKACLENFDKGSYEFLHSCGSSVQVPVSHFVRPRICSKSLLGSHACPGLCYYENSLLGCSATCEGSPYRRIAGKLTSRNRDKM
jgi:hypothetical protein